MRISFHTAFLLALVFGIVNPCFGAPAAKKTGADDLKQYISELKNNPGDKALREKIIKAVAGMKKDPAVPEDVERNMARGTAFAQKASDSLGYKKAITEFEAAANGAPWLALAYYNMGVMQEKAGLFNDAIQSLRFYLMAAPDAKNARDVKNKIYALEADAEAMAAGLNAPAPDAAPAAKAGAGPALAIEPEKELKIIKMTIEKRAKLPDFSGNWYFKEAIRGEEVTIHAFEITKSDNGDLTLIPPKRAADSYATINVFEIVDKTLKLQMRWKMKSVVGYWKTETYILNMSPDGKLTGSHNQKSVGGRNIDMDRVLFRQ